MIKELSCWLPALVAEEELIYITKEAKNEWAQIILWPKPERAERKCLFTAACNKMHSLLPCFGQAINQTQQNTDQRIMLSDHIKHSGVRPSAKAGQIEKGDHGGLTGLRINL